MELFTQIRWRPGIGDPDFMGWLTVAAYAIATVFCFLAWLKPARAERKTLWLAVTILMSGLCLNKQLDMQSLLTDIGRVIAFQEGWYEERRVFQKWFIIALLAITGLLGAGFGWRFRTFFSRRKLLCVGIAVLLAFVLIRAISFHHVDALLNQRLQGVKVKWALELGGIFFVGLAAWREWRSKTPAALQRVAPSE